MNRPIKFRAWDSGEKEMVTNLFDRAIVNRQGAVIAQSALILMQFTGLLDKNGKEIWEGDWLRFTYWWFDGSERESTLEGEVVYLPEHMSFGLKGVKNAEWLRHIGSEPGESDVAPFAEWDFSDADFEVIGNIYENPNLLGA